MPGFWWIVAESGNMATKLAAEVEARNPLDTQKLFTKRPRQNGFFFVPPVPFCGQVFFDSLLFLLSLPPNPAANGHEFAS
jgi:hypothetical protein